MKLAKFIYLFVYFIIASSLFLFFLQINHVKAQSYNDWPTFQRNPQHTGFNAEETTLQPPLTPVWTLTAAGGISSNSIVVSGNTLYAKTNSGILYSIDVSSGAINWQVQTQGGGAVAVANNKIYAASSFCSGCGIDAFDPSTGQKLWSTVGYNPPITSGITVVGDLIYFGTDGWTFRAVDASTGNQVWGYGVTDAIFGFPALAAGNDSIVYVGDYQRAPGLYSLYQSSPGIGSSLWTLSGSNIICGRTSPSVVNNVVYISQSCGGSIIAFDATNGNRIWISESYHITQTSTAFAYNTVYTRATDGVVSAIDSATGYTRWTYNDNVSGGPETPVVVANGVVYAMSADNKIIALDAQTGTLLWQYNTSGVIQALIVANHTLFAGSSDGKIYALGVNNPPVVNPFSGATINEGQAYTSNGSFNDPTSTSWTATVDYGDGSGVQPLTLSGTNFSLSHVYKDNGTYTVTVSVTDNQGAIGTGTATVTVNNSNPNVGTITAPTSPQQVNTPITVSAPFTDPGVLDTHTAVWDWGDGITSNGTVTEANGTGSISDNHIYIAAGVYTITLSVTDKDGGQGSSIFQYVVIFDPSAGYVTGAGTITSPAGAYIQDSSLSGKAIFGFVSKYQNGANLPTGSTQFRFIIANFSFKSTSYDWLVVGGARAQYKGSGTINGSGDYGFILTSIDGQLSGGGGTDKFRLKVWDKATGNVIYDNQLGASDTSDPTTAIDSGSITIHK